MKFLKLLRKLIEGTLPQWRDFFLSYKILKKQLKLMYPEAGEAANKRPRLADDVMTREEKDFIHLLEVEIEKLNSFFVDQEEEYIIRQKVLQDRAVNALSSNEELMKLGKDIVDLHGEMVLLLNYSAFNYIGLVKILKKHDKKSGALIRQSFIEEVLQQPFYNTDSLNKLVKDCESLVALLFPETEPLVDGASVDVKRNQIAQGVREIEYMESLYMKSTVAALKVLKEIRSGSSTVNESSSSLCRRLTLALWINGVRSQ
nr:SPX1 [Phoebe bournei]